MTPMSHRLFITSLVLRAGLCPARPMPPLTREDNPSVSFADSSLYTREPMRAFKASLFEGGGSPKARRKESTPPVSGKAADSPLVRGGHFKLPPSDEGGVKSAAFDGGRDVLRG